MEDHAKISPGTECDSPITRYVVDVDDGLYYMKEKKSNVDGKPAMKFDALHRENLSQPKSTRA